MMRLITIFAATLITTAALANPTVTPADDEVAIPVESPSTEAPTKKSPAMDDSQMTLGQWVKARRAEGLSGQALANAVLAERERRTGKPPTAEDRKRAAKLAAKTEGKGKSKKPGNSPRS